MPEQRTNVSTESITLPTFRLVRNVQQQHSRKKIAMRSRLEEVRNWDSVARKSGYRKKELAEMLNVTSRQLERFFRRRRNIKPRSWLDKLLARDAMALLNHGSQVQEAAARLGFSS